jgi:hypothetical protein
MFKTSLQYTCKIILGHGKFKWLLFQMAGWVPQTLAVSSFLFMPPTSFGEWPVNSVKNWEDTWLNLELTGRWPPEIFINHYLRQIF